MIDSSRHQLESDQLGQADASNTSYDRRLSTFDGAMVVVGGIIGAGIFLNPAIVAQRTGSWSGTMLAWAVGGFVALLGALCFAELGSRRPQAGGGYVYLREAFGPLPAFLYGWTLLLVINTGGIAAVAVTFAGYASDFCGRPGHETAVAIAAVVLLTLVNILGVRFGSLAQNILTVAKLLVVLILVICGLLLLGTDSSAAAAKVTSGASAISKASFGAALIPVLFAFGGWQHANHVGGELRDPRRNLPRAILFGVLLVVAAYLLVNMAYLNGLGVEGLASSKAPAADLMRSISGENGARWIGFGIALSTFGFINLAILAGARVVQAMAADGLFLRSTAKLHPRFRTPHVALVIQAVWAIALCTSGSYGDLLDYTVFGDWIFFALVAACLFRLRRNDAAASSDQAFYKMPLFPLPVLCFIAIGIYAVWSTIEQNPSHALRGAGLIALGVPVYAWSRSRS